MPSFSLYNNEMYFIKFNDIAVFAQESGKLARTGIRYEIINLTEENEFERLCKKYPYANTKKLDYFNTDKLYIIPAYVMAFVLGLDAVDARIKEQNRENKIDELLKPEE